MSKKIPVTLVRGFLESGKTSYINQMLRESEDLTVRTLIICCEIGEQEYDENLLKTNVIVIAELDQEQMTREYFIELMRKHSPDKIIVECNMMWKPMEAELPMDWQITDQIAVLAAPTLGVYLDNMKSLIGSMLSSCDFVRINRCDSGLELIREQRAKLRPIVKNPKKTFLETESGFFTLNDVSDETPYNMEDEVIRISEENYVYWYYDCMDFREKYEGRHVLLEGNIRKQPFAPEGDFTFGKIAMTCCELDMSFIGYTAHYKKIDDVPQLSRVKIEAEVSYRQVQNQGAEVPYLIVDKMEITNPGIESWEY